MFQFSGSACNGDSREVWPVKQLSAASCSGLPSGGLLVLMQSFWFRLWYVSAESMRPPLWQELALCSRGEVCHLVPGGVGLAGPRKSRAPRSLQLCRGLHCQSWECFCTQIVWKALFIVLVLFKNVHTIYVILKKDCLHEIFCILRCVYCKKKKKRKGWKIMVFYNRQLWLHVYIIVHQPLFLRGLPAIPVILSKA